MKEGCIIGIGRGRGRGSESSISFHFHPRFIEATSKVKLKLLFPHAYAFPSLLLFHFRTINFFINK